MANRSEFVEHVLEMISGCGPVSARSMFGGYGIYRENLMFALVSEDTLYIKADDTNRSEFEALGLEPFRISRMNTVMSYYEAPADALDNPHQLCAWAMLGIEAAQRATKSKKPRT